MSVENVKNYLKKFALDGRVKEFEGSSATVELAAQIIGTQPERIAKSLTFMVEDKPVMIVAAGNMKIDNRKFKDEFQVKAKMLTSEQVDTLIGHSVGGVCPFGINEGVKVYLDVSLKKYATVFPAAGAHNAVIEMSIEELEKSAQFFCKWVDVCKLPC